MGDLLELFGGKVVCKIKVLSTIIMSQFRERDSKYHFFVLLVVKISAAKGRSKSRGKSKSESSSNNNNNDNGGSISKTSNHGLSLFAVRKTYYSEQLQYVVFTYSDKAV